MCIYAHPDPLLHIYMYIYIKYIEVLACKVGAGAHTHAHKFYSVSNSLLTTQDILWTSHRFLIYCIALLIV